jgi:hypothetical protein
MPGVLPLTDACGTNQYLLAPKRRVPIYHIPEDSILIITSVRTSEFTAQ